MFLILAPHYIESDPLHHPPTAHACIHIAQLLSLHCRPFPEVATSQHPSPLLNRHHFSSHSGIIGLDQEAPRLWTKHFYAEKPNSYSLIFLFSGEVGWWKLHTYNTTALMAAHRPSSLCTVGLQIYHIKDTANCYIIQFRKILLRLHKKKGGGWRGWGGYCLNFTRKWSIYCTRYFKSILLTRTKVFSA